jgi:hypothetical protein
MVYRADTYCSSDRGRQALGLVRAQVEAATTRIGLGAPLRCDDFLVAVRYPSRIAVIPTPYPSRIAVIPTPVNGVSGNFALAGTRELDLSVEIM